MSTWTEDAVPRRRSSRRLSVTASDVESVVSSTFSTLSTPIQGTPRKIMLPKSSMIPRLKQIEEKMASSDDEIFVVPPPTDEQPKRGRGRPRKDGSPARSKMTAIKTPASSAAAVKDAAAAAGAAVAAAITPSVKREKLTPPRSRSSSRTRKVSAAAATTPAASPKAAPKPAPVLIFDESPVVTRRSTRLATKTPSQNGHAANGTSAHQAAKTPVLERVSTEQWREKFTDDHPILTKLFIPALICLVYALAIIVPCYYFDIHKKAPVWMDQAAQRVNDMYDDFMANRAAAADKI